MRIISVCLLLVSFSAVHAADFTPIAADATVDQVLDALKSRGDTLKGFSADVNLTETDQATGDATGHSGKLVFQQLNKDDGRIRVTFTQRSEGDKIFDENHQYTLTDGWLTDRDYKKNNEVRRQVVRPGEKIDLLKLGEGPFPLPIGQDKEQVHQQFDVSLVAGAKDDPPQSVHVLLKPKPGTDLARKYAQIDVFVDRPTGMPTRIITQDVSGERVQTTLLTNLKLDTQLSDADFALPDVQGWDQTVEPYRQ
jgi:outer membrane lipoprotein-sorting protein